MFPFFKSSLPRSSKDVIARPRIHASILAFVRQARASGLEGDWINLISGKKVEPQRLEQLDKLIVDVLKNPSTQEFEIDHSQPWAELRPDVFTNRNVIHYEIPRSTRERLREEALKQVGDEAAAKQLYRQKLATLRNQLIRKYAVGQTEAVLPPLKVDLDEEQQPIPQEAYERIERIKKNYPNFMAYVVDQDADATQFFYKDFAVPAVPDKPEQESQSWDEELQSIRQSKADPTNPAVYNAYLEAKEQAVQARVSDISRAQQFIEKTKQQQRSPFDPDYNILLKNRHISKASVEALRQNSNAIRKLFFKAQIKFVSEDQSASSPRLHTLKAAVKKYQRVTNEGLLADIDRIEAFAIHFEQTQAEKYAVANFRLSDNIEGLVMPELKEHIEKQIVNQNWMWDYYNPNLPTFPLERK